MRNLKESVRKLLFFCALIVLSLTVFLLLSVNRRTQQANAEQIRQIVEKRQEEERLVNKKTKIIIEENGTIISTPLVDVTDITSTDDLGKVLLAPSDFVQKAVHSSPARMDKVTVAWRDLNLSLDPAMSNILQFTAYTTEGYTELRVRCGRSSAVLSVTAEPTTYYFPFIGMETLDMISMEMLTDYCETHIENITLVAYNASIPTYYLARGYYTNQTVPTVFLNREETFGGDSRQTLVKDNILFNLSNNTLSAYVTDGQTIRMMSNISGLGTTRDMAFSHDENYVFVTSGQCGLYVINVQDPEKLEIASHFDTLEFTTGICVDGDYVFLADRFWGITIVDASDPYAPKFVSNISEQAEYLDCSVHNGYLFVGVYQEKRVDIYDLKEITNPKKVSSIELDGAGQGTAAQGDTLFVSTGLNSSRNQSGNTYDFGTGTGNGMEIYDISDIQNPKRLSIVKVDGTMSYAGSNVWDIVVSGKYAFLANMSNGVYVYDISNPINPVCLQRYKMRLNNQEAAGEDLSFEEKIQMEVDTKWASFWHCNVLDGELLFSIPNCGIAREKLDYAKKPVKEEPWQYQIPPRTYELESDDYNISQISLAGCVWAAAQHEETIYAACGDAGLAILGPDMQQIGRIETADSVRDVKILGDKLYTAEGSAGVGIYDISGEPTLLSLTVGASSVYYSSIAVSGDGNLLIAQKAQQMVDVFDISDAQNPQLMKTGNGQGRIFARNVFSSDDTVGVVGSSQFQFFHKSIQGIESVLLLNYRYAERNGVTWAGDRYLQVAAGYATFTEKTGTETPLDVCYMKGIGGRPTVFGSTLVISNGDNNEVFIYDIANISVPVFTAKVKLDGRPDTACVLQNGEVLVPCHYSGLMRLIPKN